MKQTIILVMAMLLSSCAINPTKTGQRFSENSPTFYMSIAPSFSAPYEYEVIDDNLIFRKYTGLGGYKWGKKKEQSRKTISIAQEEKIRALAIAAVKESIPEQAEIDVIVMDGTNWYILTDYGFGPFLSASTNNPPNGFYELQKYLDSILQ